MKTAKHLLTILPDDIPMETLVEELLFSLKHSERGEFVTQEEAKKRFAKWLA